MNREYFGLGRRRYAQGCCPSDLYSRNSRDLFECEDEKLQMDRKLYLLRHITTNLEDYLATDQLPKFTALTADPKLQFLSDTSITLSSKRHLLIAHIHTLELTKEARSKDWAARDALAYPLTLCHARYSLVEGGEVFARMKAHLFR